MKAPTRIWIPVEEAIPEVEYNIKFKAQYIFPELPNRRYDFAIFDIDNNLSYLIEFDGE